MRMIKVFLAILLSTIKGIVYIIDLILIILTIYSMHDMLLQSNSLFSLDLAYGTLSIPLFISNFVYLAI